MGEREEWIRIFGNGIREVLKGLSVEYEKLQEVRLRTGLPLFIRYENREYGVTAEGRLVQPGSGDSRRLRVVTGEELRDTVECASSYSLYAYEEEIRQGFITVRGGHRIGLAGKTVTDKGEVRTIRYISSVNVRFAHQVKGCGLPVLPFLMDGDRLCSTLIISPPGGGKTTLLRDLIRLLSWGAGDMPGRNVGVADERGEIGACYEGIPQNDLGPRADVLDGCPKALGLMMLIRTMTPQVVAADELGSEEDLNAAEYGANCGCSLLATAHGSSLDEIRKKAAFRRLETKGVFDRFVILKGSERAGQVKEIRDGEGRILKEWISG